MYVRMCYTKYAAVNSIDAALNKQGIMAAYFVDAVDNYCCK